MYLIRTRLSGVWYCTGEGEGEPFPNMPGAYVINGRRIWSWKGANECTQLAQEGLTGGRVAPYTEGVTLSWADTAEVHRMTPEAIASVEAQPEWKAER